MRPIQHDSYVAAIDDEARAELIRNALQDRQAQLVSWREEPMGGGGSGSELVIITSPSPTAAATTDEASSMVAPARSIRTGALPSWIRLCFSAARHSGREP